jgi:hypothetical protein
VKCHRDAVDFGDCQKKVLGNLQFQVQATHLLKLFNFLKIKENPYASDFFKQKSAYSNYFRKEVDNGHEGSS